MAGENCTLTVSNYGTYKVRCQRIEHGMEIIATQEQGRARNAFYVTKRTTSNFAIELIFATPAKYEAFCQWLRGYGQKLISPNNTVGTMVVSVPVRKFLKSGIPASGPTASSPIEFDIHVGQVAPKIRLEFVGVRDALDITEKARYSKFLAFSTRALTYNPEIQYFYPAGTQLAGSQYGSDYLYDDPLPPDPVDIQQQVRQQQGGNI